MTIPISTNRWMALGCIDPTRCQLPTIFGEYGDVTEREPWFVTVMVRSYCSKSPPSEPCHECHHCPNMSQKTRDPSIRLSWVNLWEIWLPSYKIFQMSDHVASVVPSSRGAHGPFQSSLPSQKPFIGHGGWTWDERMGWRWMADGWGMDDLV